MWNIIPHTRTKISRTRVHTGTRQTDGFFFWDVSIRNSLRSNNNETLNKHVPRTRLMSYAACKVEFQPFDRSYSQLAFFYFL